MKATPEQFRDLIQRSRCPERQRRQRITTPAAHPWNRALAAILKRHGTGFLIALHGQRGPGKTQLGAELIRHACQAGQTAFYTLAEDIFIDIKSGRDGDETERQVLERLCKPKVLVIDEVMERAELERDKRWDRRVLTYICDRRYAAMLDTLLIGNGSQEEMECNFGPSVVSRINESGGFQLCQWNSFREDPVTK